MKGMFRYGFILALICSIAAAALAAVNSLTNTKIIAQAQAEERVSLKEVFPEGESFEAVNSGQEGSIYYKVYNRQREFIGVVFKSGGKGYSSIIETMAAMNKDGTIAAVKVLSQNETPGLGSRITEPAFIGQFSNKGIEELTGVQAITGATISSRAVMKSVKEKAEEIKMLLKL